MAGGEKQEFFLVVPFLWRSLVCGLVLEYVHGGLLDGDTRKDKKFFTSHTIPDIALRFDIRNTQNSFLMKKFLFVLLSAASAAVLAGGPIQKNVTPAKFNIVLEHNEICGCTVLEACNYNPLATSEDGSCEFKGCLIDFNRDGVVDDKDISIVLHKWERDEVHREGMKAAVNKNVIWEVWVEPIYSFSSLCMSFEDRVKEFGITPEFITKAKEQNKQLSEQLSELVFFQYPANTFGIHHLEARDKTTRELIAYTVIVMDGLTNVPEGHFILLDCVDVDTRECWSPSTFHRIEGMYPLGLQ